MMDIHRCFRCGYCKFPDDFSKYNCPPYARFRFESFSPGGRLWLTRAFLNGEVDFSKHLSEIIFSCTACKNCAENCRMGFKDEIVDWIVSARREILERGLAPPFVRDFLENIRKYGNPWGLPRKQRADWLRAKKYDGDDYLLFLGCECSYEDRGRSMAKSFVEILERAGVSFGILGENECCDGNEVFMLGELGLFQELAERNKKNMSELGVQKVIAISPHAYNAIKSYEGFEVFHYSQILRDLIQSGKIKPGELRKTVTYHDPCFLGRYNGIYEEPREVLNSVPGLRLVEMEINRKDSFCCGGGSGNFVFDLLRGSYSPARERVREAAETGAEIIAVACPACKAMLDDAAKDEGLKDRVAVMDLSEIILRCGIS
ncbi:MAG: (Fe-S)-binding protein [Archaeoglobales archaeon]|nr:(Fe-S)-binding protein [Archaeoglobales archaeon]